MNRQLLTSKELASALRKHASYVYAMRRQGFKMRGNVATLDEALDFLARVPNPRGAKNEKAPERTRGRA